MGKSAAPATPQKLRKASRRRPSPVTPEKGNVGRFRETDLVILTGMSGSGKGSVLKAFEDLGYYCVDNLPVDLIPKFAELCRSSREMRRVALVVDIREGTGLKRFPALYRRIQRAKRGQDVVSHPLLIFLQASDEALLHRFSETRRPHPLAGGRPLREGIAAERKLLAPIRDLADLVIDTSRFNVHDLRRYIADHFSGASADRSLVISCGSFGYRYGLPPDSDLVFDVRFLPNPNYIPRFQPLSGKDPAVAKYIRSFPQTKEFTRRISDLLAYLIPHYIREGKSYLTISFGCTGGRHRSVLIAETIAKNLERCGYGTKVAHRDVGK
ncbi:MAG: RNase adapter RapZ [Terriglobia bacterium]